jgi:hypothetical protein
MPIQLPPRDPKGRVAVRRLWPGAFGEANREAGALVRVPSDIAVRMVLEAEAMPAFADDGDDLKPMAGPLVAAIRAALRGDAELYGLMVAARAFAFHGVGRGIEAQRRAGERLRQIIGGLPRELRPASYSAEGFTNTFGAAPGWYAAPTLWRGPDRKAELLVHHCRRRRFQVLMRFFEALRAGHTLARGRLPCGLSIDVPPEIWAATNVVIDLITGAVTSDRRPLSTASRSRHCRARRCRVNGVASLHPWFARSLAPLWPVLLSPAARNVSQPAEVNGKCVRHA